MTSEAAELAPAVVVERAPSRMDKILHQPLTRLQTLVGLAAGLLTIIGTLVSLAGFSVSMPSKGDLVTVVQDPARRPVAEATVEILTRSDSLVTTLTSQADGKVVHRLKEGPYRVRVTHPKYGTESRNLEVHAGERSEVRVLMSPRQGASATVAKTVTQAPGTVRKFFKDLGL